jgi:hypothetical protein
MAGRLERMAGSGMQDAAMASQMRAAQPIAAQPGSSLADVMRRMSVDRPPLVGAPSPMVSPQVSGRLNRAAGQGLGYQMGRSSAAHAAAEMPNFPTPLMTEQFLNPTAVAPQSRLLQRLSGGRSAPPASPEFNVQPFNTSVGPPPAIQASTPTPRPLPNESFPNIPGLTVSDAAAVPPYFNEMRAGAQTIPPNRQRTIFDSPPSGPRPTPDANFQLIPWQPGQHGPPMPPAPGVVGTPARFPVGANQPEELGPLNLRAAYEAMRNPGRGVTFSPRGPTLIDY